jgi:hypothetical protein
LTLGQSANPAMPRRQGGEHLVVAVCVRTDSRQAAEMVQYDRQIGHLFGEGRDLRQLRKAHPGVGATASYALASARRRGIRRLPALFPSPGYRSRDAVPGDRGVLRLFSVERTRDFPKKPVYLLGTGESVETPGVNQMADFTRSPLPRRPPAPEPGRITVLGSGLGMLFFIVRRRRRMG